MMHPDFERFLVPVIKAMLIAGAAMCLLKMGRIVYLAICNDPL